MPALHQEPDDKVVVGKIKEVLEQHIGADRFGLWFADRVHFEIDRGSLVLRVDGEFALERLRGNYLRAVESAAAEVLQRIVSVRLQLAAMGPMAATDQMTAANEMAAAGDGMLAIELSPAEGSAGMSTIAARKEAPSAPKTLARRRPAAEKSCISGPIPGRSVAGSLRAKQHSPNPGPSAVGDLLVGAAIAPQSSRGISTSDRQASRATITASPPNPRSAGPEKSTKSIRVMSALGGGPAACDPAARGDCGGTGAVAASARPSGSAVRGESMTFGTFVTATSNTLATTAAQLLTADPANAAPLCFWGATGTGKTHLLSAIRHELRMRHRLPRVILLSAEEFTNDFLSCVRGTGLPAFRKRYRDVDALLIDNIQFLGGKSATLREMLYTVDAILSRRRPLVLAGDRQPLEIEGLSGELAGRMSSGLVCGINPMELQLRRELYHRHAQRSFLPWDDATIDLLAERTVGDGRVIQGLSQLVSMLQRMYRRMPTIQEITTHAGDMLQRGPKVVALVDVERAVCSAFGLSLGELKSGSKSRNVSQPRVLAMYLSRQHTTAAFAEIGRYYGDRNHSTVIAAHRRVETWLKNNQSVGGRGPKNMKAQEAIAAVENLLRIG